MAITPSYSQELRIVQKTAINLCLIINLLIFGWNGPLATAEEPAEAFLEALREEGYFDIAVDYLDALEKNDLASDEFRQLLPFEKAATLVAIAEKMKSAQAAEEQLNQAQQILTQYGGQNLSLEMQARVARYQADLYLGQARAKEMQGDSDRLTASEKQVFADAARELLKKSLDNYQQARQKVRALIDPSSPTGLKNDPQDPSSATKLKDFRLIYTQIRKRLPFVIEQLADTYPANDPQRIENLTQAIKEYNDVYDLYYKYPAGLDARLFAARCSQKLGQHKQTLIFLEDIFNLDDSNFVRNLKRNAFLVACESWNQIDPYPAYEVVARLQPVVKILNREEILQPDWLRIQLELAIAQQRAAAIVKEAEGPNSRSDSDDLERSSAKLLRFIARVPSDYRDQAKQLIAEWKISAAETTDPEAKSPETFIDARQNAKDIVLEIEALIGESFDLKKRLVTASAIEKTEIAADLGAVSQRIDEQSQSALSMLDLALDLSDETIERADSNGIRYLQCFCYYARQQYIEAAVIGEFLLSKYPTIDGTRNAMNLMIQSYVQLIEQAGDNDTTYETNHLTKACATVVERWPGSSEAGLAASTLIRLAINDKNFAAAEQYFSQIPDDYPSRSVLASRLGQRLWFDYQSQLSGNSDQHADLDHQLSRATTYLEMGAKAATLKDLDFETALGCLLLVDAHLAAGEVDQAIQRLDKSEIAPLDLVKQKHAAITSSPLADLFKQETYKIAIKTYLAAMRGSDNPQPWIEKASGVIDAMRADMESTEDPQARQRVTQIYGLIASELLKQFDQLESAAKKKEFSKNLLTFLKSIEKDSRDSRIILWAGSTLLNVANALSALEQTEDAKPLFEQAVSALSRAETLGFSGDPQESALLSELRRQRALAQRGSGNFEAATEQFIAILESNSKNLSVQLDAAETLQAWGKSTKQSKLLAEAIKGRHPFPDPKTKREVNLIWGWEKIAQATRSNEKFSDAFYQALLGSAECRFQYGILQDNSKMISSALTEIENGERRDATMGGPNWKLKFDELKIRVKQKLSQ